MAMAVVGLLAVSVKSLDLAVRHAPLPAAASRFLYYYEELTVRPRAGLWERLTLSWLLSQAAARAHGSATRGSG